MNAGTRARTRITQVHQLARASQARVGHAQASKMGGHHLAEKMVFNKHTESGGKKMTERNRFYLDVRQRVVMYPKVGRSSWDTSLVPIVRGTRRRGVVGGLNVGVRRVTSAQLLLFEIRSVWCARMSACMRADCSFAARKKT